MIGKTTVFAGLLAAVFLASAPSQAADPSPAEARAIAKEAYIYGFPIVDSYRIQHAYFVDRQNREYKGVWNQVHSAARVYTPDDKTIQTPNSDTPYSMLGLDLRAEPIVLSVPAMEQNRYFSIQFVDAYTFSFDYVGTRATGNGGGHFMIAGPGWNGETPPGVAKVIRSETNFVLAIYRTQLFDAADLDNVRKIQAAYKAQPLSAFLGKPAPAAPPAVAFVPPLTPEAQRTAPAFFGVLNFVLGLSPTAASETALMQRFARIGVGPGRSFDPAALSPALREAVQAGMADAWAELANFRTNEMDTGKILSGDMFGTREFLRNNYLYRMAGAVLGIYGNSKDEAMYPFYSVDATGKPLNGGVRYKVRFAPGQLPPANAFWSMTMYRLPESLLVANPIDRYLINSAMLPQMAKDADGGHTFYIQAASPGANEANWLPAPTGPFRVVMRIYWPKPEALSGAWKAPPMEAW